MTVRSSEELRDSHEFHFEDKSCAVFSTNGKNPTRKLPCLAFLADWREDIRCGNCFPQCLAQSSQRAPAREDVISNERDPQLSNFEDTLDLGFGTAIYSANADPVHTPKKFTRAQIEWRMDELALQFQGTKDKKIVAQVAALNRLLAKMDARDSSKPKNRQ